MDPSPEIRRRSRQSRIPDKLLVGLVVAFVLAAVATAFLTYAAVRDIVAAWTSPNLPGIAVAPQETPELREELGNASDDPMQPEDGPPPFDWDGNRRLTVLVMGLDYRDWEAGEGAPRTDTMILVSVDPASRSIGMLSIPRDLWVSIPGFEPAKINQAYRYGEVYDVEGGGPGLAMRTVEGLLGMPVHSYAQIDFGAFERFIDEIGGVKVEVPEEIEVDPLGDNNNKVLQPGVQVLPGDLALAYARSRNSTGGDFDRAERQQQVIMGIRNRILSSEMLPVLIRKAPALYDTLSTGVRTNLTPFQIVQLAWLVQQIPEENIKRGVIGPNQVTFSMSFDGQDILQPMPEEIRLLRDEVFTATGPVAPAATATTGDPRELVQAEAAIVSVLNGTLTPGLAAETRDYLQSTGLQSVEAGNADELYSQTTLIDYTGNPHTVQFLVDLMNIPPDQIYHRYDEASQADIVLLLGEDWATDNPIP